MNKFSLKPEIYFGSSSLNYLETIVAGKVFIVTDKVMINTGVVEKVTAFLDVKGIEYVVYSNVKPDPDIKAVTEGVNAMGENYPDAVIAIGGGSVIDAAKAVMFTLWMFMKNNLNIQANKPMFIAIPSTSGTGSEVTSFSVIKNGTEKLALVDEWMLPEVAILDTQFVKTVPPAITADTGLDVLTHALEAYVSTQSSDFSDALAEKTVKIIFNYLIACYKNGADLEAREKMHIASCMAGIAFTNASLGINHSLAHALGGVFGVPHGRANALFLPTVVAFNADLSNGCQTKAAQRYAYLADSLKLPAKTVHEGVTSLILAIEVLKEKLNVPKKISALKSITHDEFMLEVPKMAKQAKVDACTITNPREVTVEQFIQLYKESF